MRVDTALGYTGGAGGKSNQGWIVGSRIDAFELV